MATHQLAKGLASLGRYGDSMLMHVSPSEVEGLRALGAATGRKITTNPDTGLPEAFSFKNFLTSLIPTGIGFLLGGPAGAKIGETFGKTAQAAAPVIGGMAAGAAVASAKGEDPLLGTVMGGLGGYGGGNLAGSVGKLGAKTLNAPLNAELANRAAQQSAGGYAPTFGGTGNVGMASTFQNQLGGAGAVGNVLPSQIASTSSEAMKAGIGDLMSPGGYSRFISPEIGGSGMQLAMPVGMAALSGAQEDLYPKTDLEAEALKKAEENKYRDPRTGLLNLAQASPGLKLMATGGTVGINTSTTSSGGIQDLYGTNDQTTGAQQLSKDGYGIGRLENLASAGSRAKAADTFYAMGGPIAFAKGGHQGYLDGAGDGMSDSIPATIEGKQPARLADGEFVIPADVVSHLGNGSSKAGAKKLYAMLHNVRKARTGNSKQGKQIKPEKYMPA